MLMFQKYYPVPSIGDYIISRHYTSSQPYPVLNIVNMQHAPIKESNILNYKLKIKLQEY